MPGKHWKAQTKSNDSIYYNSFNIHKQLKRFILHLPSPVMHCKTASKLSVPIFKTTDLYIRCTYTFYGSASQLEMAMGPVTHPSWARIGSDFGQV